MAGGENGKRGENYLGRMMKDGSLRWVNIGGTKEIDLNAGDRIKICTPGGGGYGRISDAVHGIEEAVKKEDDYEHVPRANGSLSAFESDQLAST